MPRCYMVKKGGQRQQEGPSPSSPSEASVAPSCYSPPSSSTTTSLTTGPEVAQYAELQSTSLYERSAAETEAAHELLSLAQSLPPLPPAVPPTVLTLVHEPTAILPIYTYTMQPTNILIVSDESDLYQTVQIADLPIQYVDSIQEPETLEIKVEEKPVPTPNEPPAETEPTSIPTSVIQHAAKEKGSYDCNECGKRYATSSNLSRHRQTHRSLDSVAAKRCGECGKAYVSMPALSMHILTHRMGHVCAICGKQFSRPWLLRGHLRSHTGEKPYRCARCSKPFADRSNLRAHYQTHLHEKKYECKRCFKGFALKSYLNKHLESACTLDT